MKRKIGSLILKKRVVTPRDDEIRFSGREIPYLEDIKVEVEEEKLYQGEEYWVKARGI